MNNKIINLAKENNGYITNKILKEKGIASIYIYRLVEKGVFVKIHNGIFMLNDFIEDKFYSYYLINSNIVYCGETALFLNGLSNRKFDSYNVVVPYNSSIPKIIGLSVLRTRKDNINLGEAFITTPYGNLVKCYDKERCICELFIKPDNYDYEDRVYAINEYKEKYLNIEKLYSYADKLNVLENVKNVFEVIRWN